MQECEEFVCLWCDDIASNASTTNFCLMQSAIYNAINPVDILARDRVCM